MADAGERSSSSRVYEYYIHIYKIYTRFDGGNSIFFPAIYLLFIEKISGKGGAAVAAVGELYTSNIEIDKNRGPAVANVNCTRAPYRVIGKYALKNRYPILLLPIPSFS